MKGNNQTRVTRVMKRIKKSVNAFTSGVKKTLQGMMKKQQRVVKQTRQRTQQFCHDNQLVGQAVVPKKIVPDYFVTAPNWYDDFYTTAVASRNRWRAASLWILTPLSAILLICVTMLIPVQHLVPLVIQHYNNGMTTVTPFHNPYVPKNDAQIESDLARYVRNRESYSADRYEYQYRIVELMSSNGVAKAYNAIQNDHNKQSPINVLGDKAYRSVDIQSIVFLDKVMPKTPGVSPHHRNLAQVTFVVTDHDKQTGKTTSIPLTALMSWNYRGTPNNPGDRWMNWNGFAVTYYDIQKRNF